MKPFTDAKSLFKNADVTTDPEVDGTVLAKVLLAQKQAAQNGSTASGLNVYRIIFKNKATQLAAAAVIAIALVVPLSYGTAVIIRRLVSSAEIDAFSGKFELGKDIRLDLRVGTKQEPRIVLARNIRFFREGDKLLGTLRCGVCSWPKFKWRAKISLVDGARVLLSSTEHIRENSGLKPKGYADSFGLSIHFSLGSWNNPSQAQTFRVTLQRVGEETETTVDAWLESSELPVLHGWVRGVDGKPIANATVQIREQRKPGQRSIAAPEVTTDKEGYYSFDEIEWPYRVGVIVYQDEPSGQGYRHQYKRLNRVLEGSQKTDFVFDQFPKGSATLSGKAVEANGAIIKEFKVDVRLKVDWKDYSGRYLEQFGIKKTFVDSEGRFEIPDLPAGKYAVLIVPKEREMYDYLRRIDCDLVDGATTEAVIETERKNAFYGRVLFEDGSPAVLHLPGVETRIIEWTEDFPGGTTVSTVDGQGYFTAYFSEEQTERLRAGQSRLGISISGIPEKGYGMGKGQFPFELLAKKRDEAAVVKISRPIVYYGRILYENGRPAVPEMPPWPGASVSVAIRYTAATATDGGLSEDLADVDSEGYFAVYLTDEQLEQLKVGEYQLEIRHPSYEDDMTTSLIGSFPLHMLAAERRKAKGYKLPYEKMGPAFKNLEQQHASLERLRTLGSALSSYCADHQGALPTGLDELRSYDVEDLLIWAGQDVEYLGAGQFEADYGFEDISLAYDKALLQKTKGRGTNVLFLDGRVEFCRPKRIEVLGIEGVEK